ncbi:methyl-accepting chemotaxis protein [Chitinimonas koreensis]|uniref:methyl-accepting chemotaxis protein n=1 Tax=Chitinimonas koreensis TaxID=356302 RepID=UPI000686F956|nr:methyl-accepting chemotaxis protein [Chitinimonas koreensis]QNM98718.1 methyl-accepting chemotaxis protein [Chitinimonas koreensis]
MPLSVKLTLGFGSILFIMAVATFIISLTFRQVESNMSRAEKASIPQAFASDQIAFDTLRIHQLLVQAAASFSKDGFKQSDQTLSDIKLRLARLKQEYAAQGDQAMVKQVGAMEAAFASFHAQGKEMAELYMSQGGIDAAGEQLKAFDQAGAALALQVMQIQKTNLDAATTGMENVSTMLRKAQITMWVLMAVALVSGTAIAVLLRRSVMGLLGGEPAEAMRVARLIAEGDLTQPIAADGSHSLMKQMEHMRAHLNDVLRVLLQLAGQLSAHADDLASDSSRMAKAAGDGSDAASAMASTVEQMTTGIAQVSDSAATTAAMVGNAGSMANQSGGVVLNLAEGMARISERVKLSARDVAELGKQSDGIRSIVAVIKDIADQTNLLALNAAIEAARAGESGRGFAVVADEVRKLAERTAKSTRDIAEMIGTMQQNVGTVVSAMGQSVGEVTQGEALAQSASEAIRAIQTATTEVVGLVGSISVATRQSSTASQDVAGGVEHIATLSEQNSSAAARLAETAGQLKAVAGKINQLANQFKTCDSALAYGA